jgi:hypothetical protein
MMSMDTILSKAEGPDAQSDRARTPVGELSSRAHTSPDLTEI